MRAILDWAVNINIFISIYKSIYQSVSLPLYLFVYLFIYLKCTLPVRLRFLCCQSPTSGPGLLWQLTPTAVASASPTEGPPSLPTPSQLPPRPPPLSSQPLPLTEKVLWLRLFTLCYAMGSYRIQLFPDKDVGLWVQHSISNSLKERL